MSKNTPIYKYGICFVEKGHSCCVLNFDFKPFSSVSTSHCGDAGLLYTGLALFPLVTAKSWKSSLIDVMEEKARV